MCPDNTNVFAWVAVVRTQASVSAFADDVALAGDMDYCALLCSWKNHAVAEQTTYFSVTVAGLLFSVLSASSSVDSATFL